MSLNNPCVTSLNNALRQYVRKYDIRIAKIAYRSIIGTLYELVSIPLYDMTSSTQYKYTWFRIPKNATHSIMQMLNEAAPPEMNSSSVPYFRKRHIGNFKFCVIRNPWDRLVSVYCNKVLMKLMYAECWDKDFRYFIEFVSTHNLKKCDSHLKLQTAMFPVQDIDYVVRMENFNAGMQYVLNERLRLNCTIAHAGAVDHDDYKAFYNDDLCERVGQLYAEDIAFGQYQY